LQRPPRLITELIALAQEWGWSITDLARELGVHRTTLLHQRSGNHALKTSMLSRIAKRFRNDRTIRDLVWHYLTVEFEEGSHGTDVPPLPRVPDRAAASLRAYLARFSEESVHGGRGLFLMSADAALLTATSQWLQRAFKDHRIDVCMVRADRPLSASEGRFALAAPVLLIERVDFLRDAVTELIRRRADLVRPIVATSMQPPAAIADAYTRRIFTSTTRLIDLGSTSPPPPTTSHERLSAESEQQ
jgi:AcrR family transcriptional regulator